MQIGMGVNVAGVATDYSQGPLVVDPNPTDDDSPSPVPGTVELSNTDVGQNLIDVLLASNSFRANAIVFSGADQMLAELTNLRRRNG